MKRLLVTWQHKQMTPEGHCAKTTDKMIGFMQADRIVDMIRFLEGLDTTNGGCAYNDNIRVMVVDMEEFWHE